ncbi:Bug family tripartite tricarboxylate transporter substrate binding protein [Achromobacter xylosoxidans]|uniref:Bug family tripartite tricarboxylate transporter substrate binding protein n=1 Tax=Alcaligenes xylosoxydans xylosoxydans TaxID=85698 RepID=UPI0006C3C7F4|nr:tripartite tricarboxylate transporter substrate-binding protein [Achromobacter xylosoxidans]MCH4574673.1 ABC transporter substrate-binding protein [Achromobacter xylosoxidans]MDD7992545.1 tripartite tricarboxylate transporter substrate-binding protein [Achromobacter xylosoxidans]OFO64128.1 ABC transporter substrate-binding protein [Achromobacter xylosoxidans]OMG79625.1 ABC transporter substrate-binding protein [Achromobacter xylosoxidans]PNL98158.1 ABC transporter substrate-binding protein 
MKHPPEALSPARRQLLIAGLAAALLPLSARADAAYPSRPITLVVPFPAGGSVDLAGRLYAEVLGKILGVTIVVENRDGAGGAIGSQRVARAKPDGYTLVASSQSSHLANPLMHPNLGYDPIKDFASISQLARSPNVLVTSAALPVKDFAGFIAHLKAHPDDVHFATAGVGSMGQLNAELLKHTLQVGAVHVPYRGGAPLLNALLSNEAQFALDNLAPFLPHIQAGKMRALAVAAPNRLPSLPDVPTFAELGYPVLNSMSWIGLAAPAGTPPVVLQKLLEAVQTAARQEATVQSLEKSGALPPELQSPQQFTDMMSQRLALYKDLIDRAGIRPE